MAIAALAAAVTACASATDGGGAGPPGPRWAGTALDVSAGDKVSCAVAADGTPWCWGYPLSYGFPLDPGIPAEDYFPLCGDGTTSDYEWPCIVAAPLRLGTRTFVSLSAGATESAPLCGLDAAGVAWCWDSRRYLVLPPTADPSGVAGVFDCNESDWDVTCRLAPRQVKAPAPLRQYVHAGLHACAVTTAGALYCMGQNGFGQLGNPTLPGGVDTLVPVQSGLSYTAVAVGLLGNWVCALTTTGLAYCWGANDFGQLGTGNQTQRNVPTAATGGLTFTSLVAGGVHACGLRSNGQAYCWGRAPVGEVGAGGTGMYFNPTLVSGGRTWTALSAGLAHTCGIDNTGAAWCWGNDLSGQLGSGWTANSCGVAAHCASVPTAVAGGHTFAQISAGAYHTCARTTAGEVYCWGSGGLGALGDGYATGRLPLPTSSPVKVVAQ